MGNDDINTGDTTKNKYPSRSGSRAYSGSMVAHYDQSLSEHDGGPCMRGRREFDLMWSSFGAMASGKVMLTTSQVHYNVTIYKL